MKIIISCFFLLLIFVPLLASSVEKKVYIVYFGEHNGEKALHEIEKTHRSYLHSVKESEEDAKSSLLYSYKHSINGFAAKLTPAEASKLSEMEEVVSVLPSHGKYSVQTTRSWDFSGLGDRSWYDNKGGRELLLKAKYGKDVIIGVIDSGVWPESPSFSDKGMGRIPKSWKGICQEGVAFNKSHCNKKIIGARYYVKGFESVYGPVNPMEDYLSPRDMDGHGTHTASTAAGRKVSNVAALGGIAKGTASGGAPLARLAIYKACWAVPNKPKSQGNTCFAEDMLAAMDDAIADGVDILSVSIGIPDPLPFKDDFISLGALPAANRNILVVCSAGNNGPNPGTISNPAPWVITVAASSLDRDFFASVILGNGLKIIGHSVAPYKLKKGMYPLVYAGDVVFPGVPQNFVGLCHPGSLDPYKVKGKIVVCWRGAEGGLAKGMEVKRAGGVGLILVNIEANNNVLYEAHFLPATEVDYASGTKILEYIYTTRYPMALINPATTVSGYKSAPFMARFSGQGPNRVDLNILKPDITAPGINILAAWSEASSPTKTPGDHRSVKYNLHSGTSMSCPHVSGAAALLKAIHPGWSVAAIKSALMTTTIITNNLGGPITDSFGNIATPFQFGSGHFWPTSAADPGLIYDVSYNDYLLYLCSAGRNALDKIKPRFKCPNELPSSVNLNYPSFVISNLYGTVTITRTVTNVGKSKSRYFFTVESPPGVHVIVSPSILYFDRIGQKQSFKITVFPNNDPTVRRSEYVFGWYIWTDGKYHVKSPMAIYLP